MSWTTTTPTTEGWKYWRENEKLEYEIVWVWEVVEGDGDYNYFCVKKRDVINPIPAEETGGEWWDSPVPEPMDSQKIKLELAGDVDNFIGNTLSRESKRQLKFYIEQWTPRRE